MQYFFTEKDGSKTEVQLEIWRWFVEYKDGTFLLQFGMDGVFHQIGEIDQDKIKRVWMSTERGGEDIEIPWVDGMRLIHKYRHIVFNALTPEERHVKVYIFGWKLGSEYVYIFILPDGRLIISPTDKVDLEKLGV